MLSAIDLYTVRLCINNLQKQTFNIYIGFKHHFIVAVFVWRVQHHNQWNSVFQTDFEIVTGSALCGQYLKCLKEIRQIHQPLSCYCERWYPSLAHIANMWSADKIRFYTLQKCYQYILKQTIALSSVCSLSTWIKSTTSSEIWRLDSGAIWEVYCTRSMLFQKFIVRDTDSIALLIPCLSLQQTACFMTQPDQAFVFWNTETVSKATMFGHDFLCGQNV